MYRNSVYQHLNLSWKRFYEFTSYLDFVTHCNKIKLKLSLIKGHKLLMASELWSFNLELLIWSKYRLNEKLRFSFSLFFNDVDMWNIIKITSRPTRTLLQITWPDNDVDHRESLCCHVTRRPAMRFYLQFRFSLSLFTAKSLNLRTERSSNQTVRNVILHVDFVAFDPVALCVFICNKRNDDVIFVFLRLGDTVAWKWSSMWLYD